MAVAAVVAGGLSTSAGAAGLGRLTVQSGLGQPLRAEVEVTSLSREELSTLSARLATPDTFRKVGLDMSPALGALRFAVEQRPSGNPIVRITSDQPINEPFVDLLVELNWGAGRFVREYTFLLDPPELQMARESVEGKNVMSRLAAPTVVAAAPATRAAQDGARPGAGLPAPIAQRSSDSGTAGAVSALPASRPSAAQPASPAAGQDTPDQVTVQRGDTLAAIAERVKPADVAVEQAIVSIYEANPRAFFGSVHQLRAGRTLSIPDHATMQAVDAGEARRRIRMQTADFNAYRERLAGATRKVDVAEAGTSATGSVTARVDEPSAPSAAADQLRLSRSTPGSEAKAGGSATGTQGAEAAAAEARVASEAALREQTERVALLEKNIADLQRLLELKNQQMAQLQLQAEASQAGASTGGAAAGLAGSASAGAKSARQAPASGAASVAATGSATPAGSATVDAAAGGAIDAGKSASADASGSAASQQRPAIAASGTAGTALSGTTPSGTTTDGTASTSVASTSAATSNAATSNAGEKPAGTTPSVTSASATASAPESGGTTPSTADGAPKPGSTAASTATAATAAAGSAPGVAATSSASSEPTAAQAAKPAAAPKPVPASTPAPAAETDMVGQLLASPYTMPGLAAVLVALGGYGWYTMRRRRKAEKFEDSLLAADAFTANSLFGTTGGQAVDTNSPSMFGPSVRDTATDSHATEVDPIAEAEVYIAYGRESQAEEILREALKRQPERQAIRLKLLEICAGRKDAIAFGALAKEMYDQAYGANEEWPQVMTMGLALDPDNPLYSGAPVASADAAAALAASDLGEAERPAPIREGVIEQAFGQSEPDDGQDLAIGVPQSERPLPAAKPTVDDFAETQAMVAKPAVADEPAAGEPVAGEPAAFEPALDFSLDVDTALGRPADLSPAEADSAEEASELERAIGGRFELPSLDFADLDRQDGELASAPAAAPAVPEPAFAEFGFDGLGAGTPGGSGFGGASAGGATLPAFGELGKLRVELPDLDEPVSNRGNEFAALADEIGALDLTGLDGVPAAPGGSPAWQEMATKLDLASAYEEIGDRDGARELLEEVVRGGDGEQKRKAQAMLASIG